MEVTKLLRKALLSVAFAMAAITPLVARQTHPPLQEASNENTPLPKTIITLANGDRLTPRAPDAFSRQWQAEEKRHAQAMQNPAHAEQFHKFVARFAELKDAPIREKAMAVNKNVNSYIKYLSDAENNNVRDYWASPTETLIHRKGDCEDSALLKYHVLRALGVPADRLYIALVNKNNFINGEEGYMNHAVVLLNIADNGEEYAALDIQSSSLQVGHLSYFSLLNDKGRWASSGSYLTGGTKRFQEDPAMEYFLLFALLSVLAAGGVCMLTVRAFQRFDQKETNPLPAKKTAEAKLIESMGSWH